MILIMLGPPGAGKGTQAEKLMKEFSIPQISTGDMIRAEIKAASALGRKVKTLVDKGEFVSDEIMIEIIKNRISHKDCKKGFILDGFPRTIDQADELNLLLQKSKLELNAVINFQVPDNEIIERISSRRSCAKCGAAYNIITNPPIKKDVCNKCGDKVILRADDKPETIKNRLQIYREKTEPLINYYIKKKVLIDVDGRRAIDVIQKELVGLLKKRSI